jgi:hypothetical protein
VVRLRAQGRRPRRGTFAETIAAVRAFVSAPLASARMAPQARGEGAERRG